MTAPPRDLRFSTLRLGDRELVVLSWDHADEAGRGAAGVALAPSEREVLALLLEGRTNVEIAGLRGRSLGTVKKQVRAVLQKVGVTSRSELAAKLYGLTPPAPRAPASRG